MNNIKKQQTITNNQRAIKTSIKTTTNKTNEKPLAKQKTIKNNKNKQNKTIINIKKQLKTKQ